MRWCELGSCSHTPPAWKHVWCLLQVKPSVLIGLSGAGRLFTQEILEVCLLMVPCACAFCYGSTLHSSKSPVFHWQSLRFY